MPLTWFYPIYTLIGTANWTGPLSYNANITLGILSAVVSLSAILLTKKKISLFYGILLLAIITYDYLGTRTINYWLAQTPHVGILIYLYVQYIPAYLYSPLFYSLFAFSLASIYTLSLRANKNHVLGLTILGIILLSALPLGFYYPNAQNLSKGQSTVPLYTTVKDAINITSNSKGGVLVLTNSIDGNYFSYYIPNTIDPNTNDGFMNFIWYSLLHSYNPAKALAYLGIQYVIVNASEYSQYMQVLNSSKYFVLVFHENNIYIYKNLCFIPYVEEKGFWIAFNFPYIIMNLSKLTNMYSIVPFYDINDLQSLLPYVAGFIGLNISVNDIIPMLVNSSYVISASDIYINQYVDTNGYNSYDVGWIDGNPACSPDDIPSILSGPQAKPLTLSVNLPNGYYYVYILQGFYTFAPYSFGGYKISSGNTSVSSYVSDYSVYNLTWSYLGLLHVTNHKITLMPGQNAIIMKIVLVPKNLYPTLYKKAMIIMYSRSLINFTNSSVYIKIGNYSPAGYSVTIFEYPWQLYLVFTHLADVKGDVIGKFSYYHGVAYTYITANIPKVIYMEKVEWYIPMISFVIDLVLFIFLIINRKYLSH